MTEKEKLKKILEDNPRIKSFQRLIEKRLENITDPVERYTIIMDMIQGNIDILKDQVQENIDLIKKNLINK